MGDIVGYPSHTLHQQFYLVQHMVEVFRQLIELIAAARDGIRFNRSPAMISLLALLMVSIRRVTLRFIITPPNNAKPSMIKLPQIKVLTILSRVCSSSDMFRPTSRWYLPRTLNMRHAPCAPFRSGRRPV